MKAFNHLLITSVFFLFLSFFCSFFSSLHSVSPFFSSFFILFLSVGASDCSWHLYAYLTSILLCGQLSWYLYLIDEAIGDIKVESNVYIWTIKIHENILLESLSVQLIKLYFEANAPPFFFCSSFMSNSSL